MGQGQALSSGARAVRLTVAAVLAAACLSGCPNGALLPPPGDALADPVDVLALATARVSPIQAISVEARASYYADGQARKGKVIILARRPASLHFSTLSPTDDLLGVLASDGERFMSFERGTPTCYVGRACAENVGRMLPLTLEGTAVVDVLMGGAPVIRHHSQELTWDGRAGAYLVTLTGDGGLEEKLWIKHRSGDILRAELRRDGKLQVQLVFSDFEKVGGHSLPHTLQFLMTKGDVDLKIRYRDVEVNGEIGDDAFAIPCPAATTEETLPCYDDPPAATTSAPAPAPEAGPAAAPEGE